MEAQPIRYVRVTVSGPTESLAQATIYAEKPDGTSSLWTVDSAGNCTRAAVADDCDADLDSRWPVPSACLIRMAAAFCTSEGQPDEQATVQTIKAEKC